MHRRAFLASSAATLALPAITRAQSQTTLRFVPEADLAFLDPHFTTQYVTRNHGYMVFDTLFGQDASFAYSHQMLAGHVVENGGRLWKLTLRDGLVWHDGERVLARDCVASIRRWSKRDSFGEALMAATDDLSAPDDRTIQFRLKRPFPLLPDALGKSQSPMPAMMPERLANTDPFKQITEIVGSGPFRYRPDERIPGARNVYERFDKYKPRNDGTVGWTAGPKIVHFDRVVWTTLPDSATAAVALGNGEQDWWEFPPADLLPILRRNAKVKVTVLDRNGTVTIMRPNHLQPPFSNPEIRRAFMWAIDQVEQMQAVVGTDPAGYYTPVGFFCPGTPMASEAGLEPLKGPRDYEKVKEMIKRAGYAGEKTVLLVGANIPEMKATGEMMGEAMRRVGFNLDYVAQDGAANATRRTKKDPVDQGGWSAFTTGWAGTNEINPVAHFGIRGNGNSPSSWPGWCVSPELESLRDAWFEAPSLAAQQEICRKMQLQAMQDVPCYPLGLYRASTAHRTEISGVLDGFATFWNVRPA